MSDRGKGFTLLEMMVALSIIALLAAVAVPQYGMYLTRHKVKEAADLSEKVRDSIEYYYQTHEFFPLDNEQAEVPPPNKLLGNYVDGMVVENGAIHISLGNKAPKMLQGKTLTMRPVTVIDSPWSPMSWICGNSEVPEGMQASGRNKTDIKRGMLPLTCRDHNLQDQP